VRILVIEDHALVREGLLLALRALEENGQPAEVLGAKDADNAAEILAANDDFDLVVLDLMLPGTSGMAFLGVIRKRHPHIPVVILSALDDGDTVMKAMRHGAAGFVSKASPTDMLLGALREKTVRS
jgi:DNA-binding NarL/FixJ family response regulator